LYDCTPAATRQSFVSAGIPRAAPRCGERQRGGDSGETIGRDTARRFRPAALLAGVSASAWIQWHYRAGCRGKWPSEVFTTSGRTVSFGSRAASVKRGKFCNGDLTRTLILLKLCEFCCAGTAQPNGVGLQCRKRRRLTFGAEGMEELEAPRVGCASAREWRQPRRDVPKGLTRPGRDRGLFRRRRCGAPRYVADANV
jgi:hypothetical protein